MKLKYLGTAAAEGVPALFCHCENCKRARALGGRNVRTRSQAMIDGKILLDFPPDTLFHLYTNGIDISDVQTLLITHTHSDHFYPQDIAMRRPGFSHLDDGVKLHIYGSDDLFVPFSTYVDVYQRHYSADRPGRVELHTVAPFVPFEAEGYRITALRAWHGTENPYIYMVEKDGKSLLYAHDTDVFPEETWHYLEENACSFDLVSMDCTEGTRPIRYHGHMSFARNLETRDRLQAMGALREGCHLVLNHFSHNGIHACYDDLCPIAVAEGFEVSFDGMEIEI